MSLKIVTMPKKVFTRKSIFSKNALKLIYNKNGAYRAPHRSLKITEFFYKRPMDVLPRGNLFPASFFLPMGNKWADNYKSWTHWREPIAPSFYNILFYRAYGALHMSLKML